MVPVKSAQEKETISHSAPVVGFCCSFFSTTKKNSRVHDAPRSPTDSERSSLNPSPKASPPVTMVYPLENPSFVALATRAIYYEQKEPFYHCVSDPNTRKPLYTFSSTRRFDVSFLRVSLIIYHKILCSSLIETLDLFYREPKEDANKEEEIFQHNKAILSQMRKESEKLHLLCPKTPEDIVNLKDYFYKISEFFSGIQNQLEQWNPNVLGRKTFLLKELYKDFQRTLAFVFLYSENAQCIEKNEIGRTLNMTAIRQEAANRYVDASFSQEKKAAIWKESKKLWTAKRMMQVVEKAELNKNDTSNLREKLQQSAVKILNEASYGKQNLDQFKRHFFEDIPEAFILASDDLTLKTAIEGIDKIAVAVLTYKIEVSAESTLETIEKDIKDYEEGEESLSILSDFSSEGSENEEKSNFLLTF